MYLNMFKLFKGFQVLVGSLYILINLASIYHTIKFQYWVLITHIYAKVCLFSCKFPRRSYDSYMM